MPPTNKLAQQGPSFRRVIGNVLKARLVGVRYTHVAFDPRSIPSISAPHQLVALPRSRKKRRPEEGSVNVHKLIQAQQDLAELGQRFVGVGGGVASRESPLGFDEGQHLRPFLFRGDSSEGDAVGVIDGRGEWRLFCGVDALRELFGLLSHEW